MHGRLADPNCTIGTDPRADPRMVKALAPFGLDGHMPVPPVTPDAPLPDRLAAVAATENRMGAVLEELAQTLPIANGIATMTTTITGVDGNDIALYITHPIPAGGELPGVVHFHGGGMAINSQGELIGVPTQAFPGTDVTGKISEIGPINFARPFLDQIP